MTEQSKENVSYAEKAQGFKYDFTPSDLEALILHSKECPECAENLIKEKTCEKVRGEAGMSICHQTLVVKSSYPHNVLL